MQYPQGFGCVLRKRKKGPKKAIFAILSPVRLPFRHTGNAWIIESFAADGNANSE